MVELSDLGGNDLELDPLSGDDVLFEQVERYLLKKLSFPRLDKMSGYLAATLLNSPDRATANQAISGIGLSRRRIEQKFLSSTGLNIGSFCRKIRFQKAIDSLSNNQKEHSLTELGLSAGYYDQSHFISEFRGFTSITPLMYLKQKNDLQKFLASLSTDRQ